VSTSTSDFWRASSRTPIRRGFSRAGPRCVDGRQVDIQCYCGTKRVLEFHIDLVVGSLMTAEPEIADAPALIPVPEIERPRVRL
jgi:hypothetical protein